MKKSIALLLVCVCLVGCLSGCQGDPSGQESVETTVTAETGEINYTPYLCPWEGVVTAQGDGLLHYYFMAAEDLFEGRWGDSCLLVLPDGTTVLFDSGVRGYGPVLLKNLQKMGVARLDYIVISHPHSDHQNGVFHPDNIESGVLGNIPVGKVYHTKIVTTARDDHAYVEDACKAKNIPCEILEMGSHVQLTGDVSMEVLWPSVGTSEQVTQTDQYNLHINQNSMVARINYGAHRALFAGDIHSMSELMCLSRNGAEKLAADLLKVPHHGQDTSSTMEFLMAVSPKLAVATGRAEITESVRSSYQQVSSQLLCDLDYGYIHVAADNAGTLTWESSRTP